MRILKGTRLRLRALFAKSATDRDLDEEIRLHLELETDKNIRAGMRPGEARRQALLAFGGVEQTKERHRDGWGIRWIHELVADSRYALRVMRRNPVLAGAAIVTLALGIGANTAIFSAVNAVILRPLPFAHPDRLVMLWESNPEYGWRQETAAPANMLDWRAQVRGFQDVAAYADFDVPVTLSGAGAPRLLKGTLVTGNFFSVLGVPAETGRMLRDAETWDTGAHVAVISDRLWRNQFDRDPAIAGRSIVLNGRQVQIVGVAPPSFNYPSQDVDLWAPVRWNQADRDKASFRRAHWLRPIARLQPGVTLDEADAQLQIVVTRLQKQYPAINRVMGAGMTPLHAFLVRDTRQPLTLLLAAVALLLLIACANVGNLLLVQAAGRDREAAMRLTLGAGRWRLVRQALTESLMLSAMGGAAGLLLGWWGTQGLLALQPAGLLPVSDVGIDWRVLAYIVAATTASGLLFGTAPALWNSRRVPADVLREGGRTRKPWRPHPALGQRAGGRRGRNRAAADGGRRPAGPEFPRPRAGRPGLRSPGCPHGQARRQRAGVRHRRQGARVLRRADPACARPASGGVGSRRGRSAADRLGMDEPVRGGRMAVRQVRPGRGAS